MTHDLKPKRSISEDVISSLAINRTQFTSCEPNHQEIFRNDTTAVEVIVKQTPNKNKKKTNASNTVFDNNKIKKFADDIEKLKIQLDEAHTNLDETKKGYRIIMLEMQKQLEAAYQRDFKRQTRNVILQLEKEKLKALLESKSKLVTKLRKELLSMRRILKVVIKGIRCAPKLPDTVLSKSDSEYAEFEQDLQKETLFLSNILDNNGITFESMISSKIL